MSSRTSVALAGAGIGGLIAYRAVKSATARRLLKGPRDEHIVIVGAGFGGTTVARTLARLLPRAGQGRITLIDRNNFLLFTPLLAEIACGELEGRYIVAPLHSLSRRIAFEQGVIEQIDLASRSIVYIVESGLRKTIRADHLVVALGGVSNYHHLPGVREHSIAVKTIGDAVSIRNRVLRCLEAANVEHDPAVRARLLTFVVGGGGFTGVETMGAINDLARASAGEYEHVGAGDIRAELIQPLGRLLEEMDEDLASYTARLLERHGVRVRLKTEIKSADANGVTVEPGGRIEASTLIWAGGVAPNPLAASLDCEHGKTGGIAVDRTCAVRGRPGVWALGDCADVPRLDGHGTYGATAQNATREGALIAENIVAAMRGEPPRPFAYEPIGEAAVIGRHSGVARIYGWRFSGLPAWAMWRAIYVAKMPTVAQRVRIVFDWLLDAAFGRIVAEVPEPSAPRVSA